MESLLAEEAVDAAGTSAMRDIVDSVLRNMPMHG
jgi:hypothetical protein